MKTRAAKQVHVYIFHYSVRNANYSVVRRATFKVESNFSHICVH